MIYTVVWAPSARDELADIWNRATDQQAVAEAANRIDRLLKRNPLNQVSHVHEGLYSFISDPLVILLEVRVDDRPVHIVQAKRA